jgi:hypothetical protein
MISPIPKFMEVFEFPATCTSTTLGTVHCTAYVMAEGRSDINFVIVSMTAWTEENRAYQIVFKMMKKVRIRHSHVVHVVTLDPGGDSSEGAV